MTLNEYTEGIAAYKKELERQEKAPKTIKSYTADLERLRVFLTESGKAPADTVGKADVISFKKAMQSAGMSTATINRRIIAVNSYFKFAGYTAEADTKTINRQTTTDLDAVITVSDYKRMLRAAIYPTQQAIRAGMRPDLQAWAIMQTLASTGIRFSELQYITVDAVRESSKKHAIKFISKGAKERSVPITKELRKFLQDYCAEQGITGGYIFGTRNGTPISNEQISRRLKKIAGYARVNKDKIHPHSFRHFFAKVYMSTVKRWDELQDILGHSTTSVTQIYTRTTSKEKADHISECKLLYTREELAAEEEKEKKEKKKNKK